MLIMMTGKRNYRVLNKDNSGHASAFNLISGRSLADVKMSRFPVFTVNMGDDMYIVRIRHSDVDIIFNGMVSAYESRGDFYSCVMDVFSEVTGIPEMDLHH